MVAHSAVDSEKVVIVVQGLIDLVDELNTNKFTQTEDFPAIADAQRLLRTIAWAKEARQDGKR